MSDPRLRKRTSLNVQKIANSLDNQMAYSRRSSFRPYRRYGRRYSSYGRSHRSRSGGQFAAANGQRDASRTVLKWSHVQNIQAKRVSIGSEENNNLVVSTQGISQYNAWTALYNSGFFQHLADMYDQVKLNAVKVKITLLSADSAIYSSNANPVFISAWDRNGISVSTNKLEPFKFISSYGSAITRPLTVGANFGMTRYLYTSTMSEKSQYIPTSMIQTLSSSDSDTSVTSFQTPFKPTLLLGVYSNISTGTVYNLSFNIEWQFDVTFRGTRNDPNASN